MYLSLGVPLSMTPLDLLVKRFAWALAFATALIFAAGCAEVPHAKPAAAPQAVFYPPAPDLPRIQHLATYANARDVSGARSGLADFLLGAETQGQELMRPYGATLFGGKIYVADSRAPGLVIFDLVGQRFLIENGTGLGRMQRPINVTIDQDGTKYVTDTAKNQILVYDGGNRFVNAFGEKGEFKPVDTAVLGEQLYVVDIEHHEVQVRDKRSGKLQFKFGNSGADDQRLFQPTNLAVGPEGDIYVVGTGNFRVLRFTREGKFVRSYGKPGQSPGTFARPKGIAIDRAGRLYVGDAAFQNVQVFDNSGRVLMVFGQPPDGSEGLNLPTGVSIDYDNVALFRDRAAPGFAIEYLILVVSQFGPNKVDVFGFGKMNGVSYPVEDKSAAKPGS